MGSALFVFGAAGAGKSTFCSNIKYHSNQVGRDIKIVNLDPAQISDKDEYVIDLRDYITVNEVMENYDYGPNGGLIVALEELYENIGELGLEELESEYLIFDCPGQIELFVHSDVLGKIIKYVGNYFKCCALYLMESQYLTDINKYIHGCSCCLISMCRLSIPYICLITKMDLIKDQDNIEMFYCPNEALKELIDDSKYSRLTSTMLDFISSNSMINFIPVRWDDEDALNEVLYAIDNSVQYYDDAEIRMKNYE